MPQLNPAPWFLVLILTWTVLLFIFLKKTTNSKHLNNPLQKTVEAQNTAPWYWPWS